MSGPGAAVFRHDVGKTHASGRIWDSNQVLACRTLNLAAGKLGLALQLLIAVGTVEFKVVRIHSLYLYKRNGREKSMSHFFHTFWPQNPLSLLYAVETLPL